MFVFMAMTGLLVWGLVMAAVILHDVHRHPPVAQPAPGHGGAMTARGVAYVPGPQYHSYSFAELREIACRQALETAQAVPYVPGGVAEPHAVG